MAGSKRLLLAAILAPLCAPLVLTAAQLLFGGYTFGAPGHFEKYQDIVMLQFLIAYPIGLGLGVPLILILNRIRRLTIANCLFWGMLLAALAGAAFFTVLTGMPEPVGLGVLTALSSFAGALDAVAFGIIARLPLRATRSPGRSDIKFR